jgi:iron complex transport system substrate-binding protein
MCALAVLAIAACSRSHAAAAASTARRIVSLAPSTTEALFAIGAGDRVVGRSRFCDFPPAATALPSVGGLEPELEAILDLHPDLVVGISGLSSARLVDKLRARGISTLIAETESLAAVEDLLTALGRRTGHENEAVRLASAIDTRAHAIERAVDAEARPRVLMVVSLAPVVAAGPKSFADELIRRSGGQNVLLDGGAWPRVGLERVVELDPDVVLDATIAGSEDVRGIAPNTPGWSSVRAVRQGHVLPVRDERVLRPGPRVVDGLALLARALHPSVPIPSFVGE